MHQYSSHEEYQQKLWAQIKRVKANYVDLIARVENLPPPSTPQVSKRITTLVGFVFFSLFLLVVLMVPNDNGIYLFDTLTTLQGVAVMFAGLLVSQVLGYFLSHLWVGMRIDNKHLLTSFEALLYVPALECPYCEGKIDLYSQWECGHCGHVVRRGKKGFKNLAIDPCPHPTCGKAPIAILCPHDSEQPHDIALNPEEYDKAPKDRDGFVGTLTRLRKIEKKAS